MAAELLAAVCLRRRRPTGGGDIFDHDQGRDLCAAAAGVAVVRPHPVPGAPAPFNDGWLFGIGLVTLALGTAGMLTARQPQRLVAYCVISSAGTLLTALGLGGAGMKSAALFYLVSSVLATGAFFMLSEMIERTQRSGEDVRVEPFESFGPEDQLDPSASR